MPDHFWVPKISDTWIGQHRIALIFLPCFTIIYTISNALVLVYTGIFLFQLRIMMGKNGNKRIFAKSGSIVFVYYRAPRKNCTYGIRIQSNFLLFPMDKISTGGMTPVHGTP